MRTRLVGLGMQFLCVEGAYLVRVVVYRLVARKCLTRTDRVCLSRNRARGFGDAGGRAFSEWRAAPLRRLLGARNELTSARAARPCCTPRGEPGEKLRGLRVPCSM